MTHTEELAARKARQDKFLEQLESLAGKQVQIYQGRLHVCGKLHIQPNNQFGVYVTEAHVGFAGADFILRDVSEVHGDGVWLH